MRRLTPKQDMFARLYVKNGGNATEAYREAYDTHTSPTVQAVRGCELRKNPAVAQRIDQFQKEVAACSDLTPVEIMAEVKAIADTAPDRRTQLDALRVIGKWIGMERGAIAPSQPPASDADTALEQAIIDAMG